MSHSLCVTWMISLDLVVTLKIINILVSVLVPTQVTRIHLVIASIRQLRIAWLSLSLHHVNLMVALLMMDQSVLSQMTPMMPQKMSLSLSTVERPQYLKKMVAIPVTVTHLIINIVLISKKLVRGATQCDKIAKRFWALVSLKWKYRLVHLSLLCLYMLYITCDRLFYINILDN